MKRILLVSCFTIVASLLYAQKIYFVYLQSENNEAFFVRMNDKLYSSSSAGYLILPRLIDSTYNFRLGFPGKDIELDFSTTVNRRDHGYLIKNFGEKGWGLFDLQSLNVQMSTSKAKGTSEVNTPNNAQVDAFTELLAKAADDPSLKQNVVLVKEEEKKPVAVQANEKEQKKPEIMEAVVKEEKKPDAIAMVGVKPEEKNANVDNVNEKKSELSPEKKSEVNTAVENKSEPGKIVAVVASRGMDSAIKAGEIKSGEAYKKSQVIKISGTSTREGFESVFVDEYQDGKDTIRILIPGQSNEAVAKQEETKPDPTKESKKFLDISSDTAQVISKPESETKKEEGIKWWPFGKNKDSEASKTRSQTKNEEPRKWNLFSKSKKNSGEAERCQSASNDDFLKLRRKMAGKTNDDGMLDEAGKYFKEKCFSTEQIKNLSSMFLSNASKYNFFELAHNYVTDKENFSSLQTELKDEYYVARFKTLVGN